MIKRKLGAVGESVEERGWPMKDRPRTGTCVRERQARCGSPAEPTSPEGGVSDAQPIVDLVLLDGYCETPGAVLVDEGDIITAAGISAGIDMALYLIVRLHSEDRAREIKRRLQYEPDPPV
jgi:hypothetical protein